MKTAAHGELPPPPGFARVSDEGFTRVPDEESLLTLSFDGARWGQRTAGCGAFVVLGLLSILFGYAIITRLVRLMAAKSSLNAYLGPAPYVLGALFIWLFIWLIFCLRQEYRLRMVFRFFPDACHVSLTPTFFTHAPQVYTFDRETMFCVKGERLWLVPPQGMPRFIRLELLMTDAQKAYLLAQFLEIQRRLGGTLVVFGTLRAHRRLQLRMWHVLCQGLIGEAIKFVALIIGMLILFVALVKFL